MGCACLKSDVVIKSNKILSLSGNLIGNPENYSLQSHPNYSNNNLISQRNVVSNNFRYQSSLNRNSVNNNFYGNIHSKFNFLILIKEIQVLGTISILVRT